MRTKKPDALFDKPMTNSGWLELEKLYRISVESKHLLGPDGCWYVTHFGLLLLAGRNHWEQEVVA